MVPVQEELNGAEKQVATCIGRVDAMDFFYIRIVWAGLKKNLNSLRLLTRQFTIDRELRLQSVIAP